MSGSQYILSVVDYTMPTNCNHKRYVICVVSGISLPPITNLKGLDKLLALVP